MEQWRANLRKLMIQTELEDDEDEFVEQILLGPLLNNLLVPLPKHGGSRPGRRANIQREREEGHERIWKDYFCDTPVYGEALFRKRYRMRKGLFNRIVNAVCQYDNYFVRKRDATGLLGLSSIQKVAAAIRMLEYGVSADADDEYCKLGESTSVECMKRFVQAIRAIFEADYLRQPTRADLEAQVHVNEQRGFPGMFASLDCLHYQWEKYSVGWQGRFQNKDRHRSITLEAIADQSLWIWHAFFVLSGKNTTVNILDRSPLVASFLHSEDDEEIGFTVNGTKYNKCYLLVDGIYPKSSIFVQAIDEVQGNKQSHFNKLHEDGRKAVERAFGLLQARFTIVQNPCRKWTMPTVKDILMACVVLHNMVIEDERDELLEPLFETAPVMSVRRDISLEDYLHGMEEIEDIPAHSTLQNDLAQHLWALEGNRILIPNSSAAST